MNAILGRFKPGEAGFDVMHFNTHKTFSTPHGGGGPGAGPVGVGEQAACRSCPRRVSCARTMARSGSSARASGRRRSAACGRSWAAPASSCARTRICARMAAAGCERSPRTRCWPPTTSRRAWAGHTTCRSSGLQARVRRVGSASLKKRTGVRTLDIAKRLIDYGFHPPTIYFPLIVEEGMLIEPTETESLETLDAFADALIEIAARGRRRDPELVTRRAARRTGAAPRRGDRRPPAEPALAADGRGGDSLPGLAAASTGGVPTPPGSGI